MSTHLPGFSIIFQVFSIILLAGCCLAVVSDYSIYLYCFLLNSLATGQLFMLHAVGPPLFWAIQATQGYLDNQVTPPSTYKPVYIYLETLAM